MFSDPERMHETEITIQGLKQVFIFYSVKAVFQLLHILLSQLKHRSKLKHKVSSFVLCECLHACLV